MDPKLQEEFENTRENQKALNAPFYFEELELSKFIGEYLDSVKDLSKLLIEPLDKEKTVTA